MSSEVEKSLNVSGHLTLCIQRTVRDVSTSLDMTKTRGRFGEPPYLFVLLPGQSAEQKCAKHDEENVRDPDEQFRMHFWISAKGVGDDDEKEISYRDNQP